MATIVVILPLHTGGDYAARGSRSPNESPSAFPKVSGTYRKEVQTNSPPPPPFPPPAFTSFSSNGSADVPGPTGRACSGGLPHDTGAFQPAIIPIPPDIPPQKEAATKGQTGRKGKHCHDVKSMTSYLFSYSHRTLLSPPTANLTHYISSPRPSPPIPPATRYLKDEGIGTTLRHALRSTAPVDAAGGPILAG